MTKEAVILTQKSEGRDYRSTDGVFAPPAITDAAGLRARVFAQLYHIHAATPVKCPLQAGFAPPEHDGTRIDIPSSEGRSGGPGC